MNTPGRFDVSVHSSREDVGSRAAAIAGAVLANATPGEPALLLLSGGSSVLDVCAELTRLPLPWPAVHVGQLDERVAPPSHPERAWPGIEASFLAHTGAEVAGRYPIPVDDFEAEKAAAVYDDVLGGLARQVRDIVAVCGLGEDGHVASLLAGDERTGTDRRALTTGPYAGLSRITVSMPFLQALPCIVVVASGEAKAPAMQRLISSSADIPAACLPAHTKFVIDRRAAALMNQSPSQQ